MFEEREDEIRIDRLNSHVERLSEREEKNLIIPIRIVAVQGEAKRLGKDNKPIYCKVEGLDKDENEGSLVSNGDYTLFVDEISDTGFVKMYLFGADHSEFISRDEFKKEFFVLC